MLDYLLECLSLLLRWLHVITGIAWIGASFYFVWLDNSLEPPQANDLKAKGVSGELWAVHGGGFYNPQKYLVAPPFMPERLHWFYWESYSTWMSGFALFTLVYLFNPQAYLIDPRILPLTSLQATSAAIAFLVLGWLVYDLIVRIVGFAERKAGLAIAVFIALATYAATQIFAGRAAFLIVGAMMATIMSANVLFWIIPGQRKVIAAMKSGLPVDPLHGRRGKQRSVHNTYLTLPVLFCMLSNHFGRLSSHPHNWLVLILIMIAAVLIRQFFILRHKHVNNFWYVLGGASLLIIVLFWVRPPAVAQAERQSQGKIDPQRVLAIVHERCYGCHANQPTLIGGGAPKGIAFESIDDVQRNAAGIVNQVVALRNMPLGNITNMTEEERTILADWLAQLSSR